MSTPSDLALFVGRLHPALVHLPIGFLAFLALVEFLAIFPRFKQANANAGILLGAAIPAALFAVVCGWVLALGGGYQEQLLRWHRWTGVATAAACLAAGLLYALKLRRAYRWSLVVGVCALVLAGHFGGSLTHGSDYLAHYAPGPLRRWLGGPTEAPSSQTAAARGGGITRRHQDGVGSAQEVRLVPYQDRPAFGTAVQPLLQDRCVSCHGPEKSKAKLRMDSLAGLLAGSENGPVVLPGKSAESVLIKRLLLPLSSDEHMPPEGKPQPSAAEIALLQWWIDAGSPAAKTIGELKPPPTVARLLEARFGAPKLARKTTPPKALPQVVALASTIGDELNIAISPLAENQPWLQCNASVAGTNFGDRELERLAQLGSNVRWLDLGGTAITDAGLTQVAAMPNLTRLHLERTTISDAGLGRIAKLGELEYLNLYATAITDAGLEDLQNLPKLKELFLWETKVSPERAKAFAEARIDRDQIQRWEEEIEQLKGKIHDSGFSLELGEVKTSLANTNTAPVNTACPISGKPVDGAKTVVYEGRLVAFCCDDCRAKFVRDPKPFLASLIPPTPASEAAGNKTK